MRWRGRQGSSNVEDRRGQSPGRSRMGRRAGGIGLGTIIIAIIIGLLGGDPAALLDSQAGGMAAPTQQQYQPSQPNDELGQFVSVVLKETENVWDELFPAQLGID
ncbi:MAG: neutral zinc metallopeptidase [Bacteroidota bacterium]